jgi:hypothetical protein
MGVDRFGWRREDRRMWRRLAPLPVAAALVAAPAAVAQAPAGPAVTVTASSVLKVKDGAVKIAAACPPTAVGSCELTATLRTKVKKRTVKLGARAITLAPGAALSFKVPLTARAKALVKEQKKVKGDVRVTARDDTGDGPTQTVKVTFKA